MQARRLAIGSQLALCSFLMCPLAQAAGMTIYRCIENDVVTYSDRPCGSTIDTYEANETRINILEVTPPSATKPARASPKRKKSGGGSIAAAQAKHTENCARIDRSLRDIRSKMRSGYDVKEGERLKDRQRKLSAQQRELRC